MKPRFEFLSTEQMDAEQKRLVERSLGGPRGTFGATLNIFLRSPGVADPIEQLGSYVRFESCIPRRIKELMILVIARNFSAQYPWSIHYPKAMDAGIPVSAINAISKGERPSGLADDEMAVYDFCRNLLEGKDVSDATFSMVREKFGEAGLAEFLAFMGYYSILSMTVILARHPARATKAPPLPAI